MHSVRTRLYKELPAKATSYNLDITLGSLNWLTAFPYFIP